MTSILAIGDCHFKVNNSKITDIMHLKIVEVAREKNPDFIVVLGDTLDRHESIHVSPLCRSVKFLKDLMEIAPVYLLMGNHDLKNNRQFLSDEHPFTALKYWGPRMTVIDTTTQIAINDQIFVLAPYVPPGRFVEALERTPEWKSASCIFAHQEFKGCKYGAMISTEGDSWDLTNPFVVSGHIHDFQEPQVNILYTGTPVQHAFGDHHDKTISYLLFKSKDIREHTRIDLQLPRKKIVKLTIQEVNNYIPNPKDELKIVIEGTSAEIKGIMKHPNVEKWQKEGHKMSYKDTTPYPDLFSYPGTISKFVGRKFSFILHTTIRDKPRLGDLFKNIFGTLSE